MMVNVKSKSNLCYFFSRKTLPLVFSLFIVTLVFSPFVSEANGWWPASPSVTVETETELRNAIDAIPDNTPYIIVILNDIMLKNTLEIPNGKIITLLGYDFPEVYLFGADRLDAIVVRSGGALCLFGYLTVAHAEGDSGRGVYVERDGSLDVSGTVISGNTAEYGGGVYNEGILNMYAGLDGREGLITNNTATLGGGVYNVGTFTMDSGVIFGNVAAKGGGVYNVGIFDKVDDAEVYGNTALSGDGDDVFTEKGWRSYILPIAVVVIVVFGVIGLLLVYRLKNRKQSVTGALVNSTTEGFSLFSQ